MLVPSLQQRNRCLLYIPQTTAVSFFQTTAATTHKLPLPPQKITSATTYRPQLPPFTASRYTNLSIS